MFKKIMEDKLLTALVVVAIVLCAVVSYFIIASNQTVPAVVLNCAAEPGDIVTEDMIQISNIPADTPEGFLRNKNSVIGYKLKTAVRPDQLLYESNFMSSWTNYSDSDKIPEDYVVTSITVPDEQACGGIITAGDYIDVMARFKYSNADNTWTGQDKTAQEINGTGRTDTGTTVNYILSNVYVLNTNSSLSESQDSDLTVAQGSNSSNASSAEGSFYIVALSYDDFKKLRQVEGVEGVEIWLNISPSQNQKEGQEPLLGQMIGQSYSYLHDAQKPVQDKEGNLIIDEFYVSKGQKIVPGSKEKDKEATNKEVTNKEEPESTGETEESKQAE